MTDFRVTSHGSIVLFEPITPDAKLFAEEAFAEAMTFGGAFVVEPRYAGPIVDDLVGQGFNVN